MTVLARRTAVLTFLAFAFAYFFSALMRAVTATLAPTLTGEFALQARDLGLLAGGYFLGFAATQLPLGAWLDRYGPRNVILCFLSVGVTGCLAFSFAGSFYGLLAARVLCGVGDSACLMAPLTGFRRWLAPEAQLRANSWMLMAGSFGMLASTLPVQWLVPLVGWRPLFWGLALAITLGIALIARQVPGWPGPRPATGASAVPAGYAAVWRNPYFRRMVPLGFFNYGGMVAMQTLWAGPWMVRVCGFTPLQAAAGLFAINLSMLAAFWLWGMLNPALTRRGLHADRLLAWGLPWSLGVLALIVATGPMAGAIGWVLFFVASTFLSLSQPAVGMAFPPTLAGRALSAYNLVIFAGVFAAQWGIGLLVDGFAAAGLGTSDAFRAAMGVSLACSTAAYLWFLLGNQDNRASTSSLA